MTNILDFSTPRLERIKARANDSPKNVIPAKAGTQLSSINIQKAGFPLPWE